MKKTTLLITMCLATLLIKCQEPDTIICYSEEDIQMKNDSIQIQKDIIHLKDVLLNETIEYYENIIVSLVVQPDSFNINTGYNGIEIIANREGNNIKLSIIEGLKRSHLWVIGGEIQVRFANDTIQYQTWLPEQRLIKY